MGKIMYFYKTKLQDEKEIFEKFQITPSIESEYELEYLGYDKWEI